MLATACTEVVCTKAEIPEVTRSRYYSSDVRASFCKYAEIITY